MPGPTRAIFTAAAMLFVAAVDNAAVAGETVSYTYDALGRLVVARHTGSANNNLEVAPKYDAAGNRLKYVVKGSPRSAVIVVPLNKFTLIPVDPER